MTTSYADLRAGQRADLVAELVTRRSIEFAGERVHRLLVDDRDGDRFAVFVDPDSGFLPGLRTGGRYRFEGLLPADPGTDAGPVALDAALAAGTARLGVERTFGIVDHATTVTRAGTDRPVGDAGDGTGPTRGDG
jgi:hypothetical protein